MIKTKYTTGFEKFWRTWCDVTGKKTDKPEAFSYWKRDKLEGDEDELIRILLLQSDERKKTKEWQPRWCFCRKWLNRRRYEYIPEHQTPEEHQASEQQALEKKRQEIRNLEKDYYAGKTDDELNEYLKDPKLIHRRWLIKEILNERN